VRLATDLAGRIDVHPRLETVAPTPFSLVSFAHLDGNEATMRLVEAINATKTLYVVPSTLGERTFVRVAIGSTLTESRHVEAVWQTIEAVA
jgi:hypothetical protein